jgi:ribosome biogenesis GTPase
VTLPVRAVIIKSARRVFDCQTESGELVSATALGNLLKQEQLCVGDSVLIKDGIIHELYPRKNVVYRQLVRDKSRTHVASNVDFLLIVLSAQMPVFKEGILDRYLIRSAQWNIPALVIFNKMDLFSEETSLSLSYQWERIKTCAHSAYEVSSKTPSYKQRFLSSGFEELKAAIASKTVLLLGPSGVGKSHLISALSEGQLLLKSNDVGRVGKGVHTTTWAERYQCKNFSIIDSPGVRSISLNDLLPDELIHYYPDLLPITLKCKFTNCDHSEKSSRCAFALAENKDNIFIQSRLESYLRIKEELAQGDQWDKDHY